MPHLHIMTSTLFTCRVSTCLISLSISLKDVSSDVDLVSARVLTLCGGVVSAGLLVGALDTVLDSNARVSPFRVLLQVPGSQISWVIASGELKHLIEFSLGLSSHLTLFCLSLRSHRRGGEQALGLAGAQPAPLSVCV